MTEIALTFLRAERLRAKPQRGAGVVETWERFVRGLALPVVSEDKASVGGYVLAVLRDGVRRADHVQAVTALAFDHDDGTISIDTAHEALRRYRHVVYSTASHEPTAPRWRAIVELSRTITVDEHRVLYPHAARTMAGCGIPVDLSCKDPCRLWYLPTVRPGRQHEHVASDGPALDVDSVLPVARAVVEHRTACAPVAPDAHADRYAAAALGRAVAAVASAGEGQRNVTLNREAYTLARLHELDDAAIAGALEGAARACGLPATEAQKTIASALRARRGVA